MDEAIQELKCIAKFNGKNLSDETLKKLEYLTIEINKEILQVFFIIVEDFIYLQALRIFDYKSIG